MTSISDQPQARPPHSFVDEQRQRISREEGPAGKRPSGAIAHQRYKAPDLDAAEVFWRKIGLRFLLKDPRWVIFEMLGGTHLVVFKGEAEGDRLPFQLMVDDLDATHERLELEGLNPSEIVANEIHDSFSITDPSGRLLQVLDSHATGLV